MIKTDKVKIVIFSGGAGAASLLRGLKHFDTTGEAMKITSVINGFDDGASGGAVRKVMNVLCPGDLRKNQWHQHRWKYGDKRNMVLEEFANKRFTLTKRQELNEILNILDLWDFEYKNFYKKMVMIFFNMPKSKEIIYDSFNLSNIIYATSCKINGYEWTFNHFKELFSIDDDVMLISEDNLQLCGVSKSGEIIETETPGIIKRHNKKDPIDRIFFIPYDKKDLFNKDKLCWEKNSLKPKMTKYAGKAIDEADLLIFAPGTQWSSLIPTYATDGFDALIKKSQAKKILLMNNTEDYDNLGQTAGDILTSISKYLSLEDIDIFINANTPNNLLIDVLGYKFSDNVYLRELGLINNSLHDYRSTSTEILKHYYNIGKTNIKFFDFDDTIYSRDPKHVKISDANLILLNEIANYSKCVIISGNDYDTIHKKLVKRFGTNLSNNNIKFDIWADGGVIQYKNSKIVDRSDQHLLVSVKYILNLLKDTLKIPSDMIFLRGDWPNQSLDKLTCIGIKPLTDLEKRLLILFLNNYFMNTHIIENEAKEIGLTGIDILNKNTNKTYVLKYYDNPERYKNKFYIGDELHDGNDKEISEQCEFRYNVKSPYDTNILLTLMKAEKI